MMTVRMVIAWLCLSALVVESFSAEGADAGVVGGSFQARAAKSGVGVSAVAREKVVLPAQRAYSLADIMEDPGSFVGRKVFFYCRFAERSSLFKPLATRFNPQSYLNFTVWPEETELWIDSGRRKSLPTLYAPLADTKLAEFLLNREMYDLIAVSGYVSSQYSDTPWIRVNALEAVSGPGNTIDPAAILELRDGLAALQGNNLNGAVRLLQQALGRSLPDSYAARAHEYLALARIQAGDSQGGREELGQVLEKGGDNPTIQLALASLDLKTGDFTTALMRSENLNSDRHQSLLAAGIAAEAIAKRGDLTEAFQRLTAAAATPGISKREESQLEVHRARIYSAADRLPEAEEIYLRLTTAGSGLEGESWLYAEQAALLEKDFRQSGSEEKLEQAIASYRQSLVPGAPGLATFYKIGELELERQTTTVNVMAEVESLARQMQRISADYLPARILLARVEIARGGDAEARALCQEILGQVDKNDHVLLDALAKAYAELGDRETASELSGRAEFAQRLQRWDGNIPMREPGLAAAPLDRGARVSLPSRPDNLAEGGDIFAMTRSDSPDVRTQVKNIPAPSEPMAEVNPSRLGELPELGAIEHRVVIDTEIEGMGFDVPANEWSAASSGAGASNLIDFTPPAMPVSDLVDSRGVANRRPLSPTTPLDSGALGGKAETDSTPNTEKRSETAGIGLSDMPYVEMLGVGSDLPYRVHSPMNLPESIGGGSQAKPAAPVIRPTPELATRDAGFSAPAPVVKTARPDLGNDNWVDIPLVGHPEMDMVVGLGRLSGPNQAPPAGVALPSPSLAPVVANPTPAALSINPPVPARAAPAARSRSLGLAALPSRQVTPETPVETGEDIQKSVAPSIPDYETGYRSVPGERGGRRRYQPWTKAEGGSGNPLGKIGNWYGGVRKKLRNLGAPPALPTGVKAAGASALIIPGSPARITPRPVDGGVQVTVPDAFTFSPDNSPIIIGEYHVPQNNREEEALPSRNANLYRRQRDGVRRPAEIISGETVLPDVNPMVSPDDQAVHRTEVLLPTSPEGIGKRTAADQLQ
ncbi:MAG: hypothetical protein LBU79_07855 [Planctomycetota bacterium]|jgi:Tfp pilus assembly protein PilF|nr:hypothetical protein [Planctomycetota bacterium]